MTLHSNANTTWLTLAEAEILRLGLNPELLEVLRAFGGSDAPGPATLAAETPTPTSAEGPALPRPPSANPPNAEIGAATDVPNGLPDLIASALAGEVDADQASMFARRFSSVSALLLEQGTATSRLLRLALYRRSQQILGGTGTGQALRIRALVDFMWSQALVLGDAERLSHLATLEELVKGGDLKYDEVSPGVRHGLLEGQTRGGPAHINVLRIRPGACRMRAVDARGAGMSTDLAALAEGVGACAAVSGGFFLYSEPDIAPPSERTDPVGLLVTDGTVENPPVFGRATLLQRDDGTFEIDRVGMDGVTVRIQCGAEKGEDAVAEEGEALDCSFIEVLVGSDGVRCVHRGDAKMVILEPGQVGVSIVGTKVLRAVRGNQQEGRKRDATSGSPDSSRTAIHVPLAGFVLVFSQSSGAATSLCTASNGFDVRITAGNSVSYRLNRKHRIEAAMAGGPILLSPGGDALDMAREDFRGSAPPVTFSQDETFDRNLLPRMGAGLCADGELVFAAVDGRNLDRALGLTLRGTSELLASLGCVRALNLDGGSSKRMVIAGKGVVCINTTEIKAKASLEAKTEAEAKTGREREKKMEQTPLLSRPVHSAIIFLSNVEQSS